eukprot:Skav211202  [mRNA]  locus=scaffold4054:73140:75014:- [translate_table: standard]
MPIAFASAKGVSEDGYIPLGRELQSLIYWWFPDTMFTLDHPSSVIFPAYSPAEQNQNIFRTMSLVTSFGTLGWVWETKLSTRLGAESWNSLDMCSTDTQIS